MNFAAMDKVDWSFYPDVNAVAITLYGKLVMSQEKTNVCT